MVEIDNLIGSILIIIITLFLFIFGIIIVENLEGTIQDINSTATQNILNSNGSQTSLSEPGTNVLANTINRTWLDMDGVGGEIRTVNTNGHVTNREFTAIMWVNITGVSQKQFLFVDNTSSIVPLMFCQSNGNLQVREQTDTDIISVDKCDDRANQWTMYSFANNGSDYLLYENSTLLGTDEESNAPIFNNFFVIGSDADSLEFTLNGSIDEVRFYNVSLSTAELNSIYTAGRSVNLTPLGNSNDNNLILYLPLNENSGTSAYDLSPQSYKNNGTITSSSYDNDRIYSNRTEGTDYIYTPTLFNIINKRYAWSQFNISYDTTTDSTAFVKTSDIKVSLSSFADWIQLIIIATVLGIVLTIIMRTFSNRSSRR